MGAHRAPSRRGRLIAVGLLVALGLAGVAVALLVLPGGSDGGTSSPGGAAGASPSAAAPSGAPADPPAGPAGDLVRWVETELPADVPLVVPDEGVREALLAAGVDEDRLPAVEAAADGGPVDALRVVDGPAPPDVLVLARFGGGDGLALVDPVAGRPTDEEVDRRRRLAAAVLANPETGATGRAAEVLRAADVDARLLGLVAGLAARFGAGVADFPLPPGAPEDPPPARTVLIDRLGGEPLVPGAPATERLQEYLAAQRRPFAPDDVTVTDDGVLIAFRYASAPDALVTGETPP